MESLLNSLPCIIYFALALAFVLILARIVQPVIIKCLSIKEKKLSLKYESDMQEKRQEFEKQLLREKNEHEVNVMKLRHDLDKDV